MYAFVCVNCVGGRDRVYVCVSIIESSSPVDSACVFVRDEIEKGEERENVKVIRGEEPECRKI